MKQFKDIKNKLQYEEYYNPNFDWHDANFYANNKLDEDFIRVFKDKVNWISISMTQDLSEDFIREFKDKVHWGCISKYQKLSESFILEFNDKIVLSDICNNNCNNWNDFNTSNNAELKELELNALSENKYKQHNFDAFATKIYSNIDSMLYDIVRIQENVELLHETVLKLNRLQNEFIDLKNQNEMLKKQISTLKNKYETF